MLNAFMNSTPKNLLITYNVVLVSSLKNKKEVVLISYFRRRLVDGKYLDALGRSWMNEGTQRS